MSAPYYSDELVTLYHGDCRELIAMTSANVLVTDPPYGIGYAVNARNWRNKGLDSLKPWKMERRGPIVGDDAPFDVTPLLRFQKIALFGANHYANLPTGGRWVVWDKRRDSAPDDHSDCEFVWTNRPGADRIHRQKWRGIVREGEENCSRSRKLHPNQKPVALLGFVFDQIGVTAADVVADPYMGSGSTAVVCIRRRIPFFGVEIDERYCEIAAERCRRERLGGAAAVAPTRSPA